MKNFRFTFLFFIALFIVPKLLSGQTDTSAIKNIITKTELSGQWFLAYNYNLSENFNKFYLKRGYFTVKTKINEGISVRYTQDITLDNEGEDAGNVEIRLKYLYMKFDAPKTSFLRNTYFEFGLVHRPWMDYEQKINNYRVQDKMLSEKFSVLNSADFGLTIGGNIGGKLSAAQQKQFGSAYPGKYGSFSVGIYNGGGYHAVEYNNNKTFEGRISLRPLPDKIPGLQFSYVKSFGKANTITDNSDFNTDLLFISTQSKYHTLTAQVFKASGNYTGDYVNTNLISLKNEGFSVFGELFFGKSAFSTFGRYDFFRLYDSQISRKESFSGGITYHFLENKLVLFYQTDFSSVSRNNQIEAVLEIKF